MDWSTIIVGVLAFLGTLIGVISGNKLTIYRITQLEKKVEEHNSVISRTYKVENRLDAVEKDISEIKNHYTN